MDSMRTQLAELLGKTPDKVEDKKAVRIVCPRCKTVFTSRKEFLGHKKKTRRALEKESDKLLRKAKRRFRKKQFNKPKLSEIEKSERERLQRRGFSEGAFVPSSNVRKVTK
ncbi:hypothetical protein QWY82_12580 [Simiduia curdlanivorans]|uniref:Uncharacterized protein n=1 Tax=Simiduia curdlanivorans TaxID=1492769 RepID=A0ABV8V811_9GAMM|nr:hypothetical protein [Simiduia curdlanivorans]MDN3639632.1 hypothetical protein [Simiduia curdlanivorans]